MHEFEYLFALKLSIFSFLLKKLILIFHLVDHYCGCLSITFSNYRSYYLFLLLFITLLGNIKQTISMWVPLSLWKINPKVLEKTPLKIFITQNELFVYMWRLYSNLRIRKYYFLSTSKIGLERKLCILHASHFWLDRFSKKRNFYY